MAAPKQRQFQARGARRAGASVFGQIAGLRKTDDALDLKSSVALVDQDTNEVLVAKNPMRCCRSHRSPS